MILTESTFLVYAANRYENPHCLDISEFDEDLKRFQYIRKLFSRYKLLNDLKERLILNHLIIIYNCFGPNSTNMLFLKMEGYHEYLKPFIQYLNFLPQKIEYNSIVLNTNNIISDTTIITKLGEI